MFEFPPGKASCSHHRNSAGQANLKNYMPKWAAIKHWHRASHREGRRLNVERWTRSDAPTDRPTTAAVLLLIGFLYLWIRKIGEIYRGIELARIFLIQNITPYTYERRNLVPTSAPLAIEPHLLLLLAECVFLIRYTYCTADSERRQYENERYHLATSWCNHGLESKKLGHTFRTGLYDAPANTKFGEHFAVQKTQHGNVASLLVTMWCE